MPNPILQGLMNALVPMPSHGSFTDPLAGDPSDWVRPDPNVNLKGNGYLGLLKMSDGSNRTMSENSVADSEKLKQQGPPPVGMADDRYINYPTIVPTLSHDELQGLLNGGSVTPAIAGKAEDFALQRKAQGLPLFARPQDTNENVLPEFERQRLQLMPSHEAPPVLNPLQQMMSHAEGLQPPQGQPWQEAASRAQGIKPADYGENDRTYPTADTPLAAGWLNDKLDKLDILNNSSPGPLEAAAIPFYTLQDYLIANSENLLDRTGSKLLKAYAGSWPEAHTGSPTVAALASGMRPAQAAINPMKNFADPELPYKFLPAGRTYNPTVDDRLYNKILANEGISPHQTWTPRDAREAVQGLYDASQQALQDLGIKRGDTVTLHRTGAVPETGHILTPTHVDEREAAAWGSPIGLFPPNYATYEVPREAVRALVGLLARGDKLTTGEVLVPAHDLAASYQSGAKVVRSDPTSLMPSTPLRIPSWYKEAVAKSR